MKGGGVGLLSLLGLLFVGLKLTGQIAWSWWWVTSPFWGGIALALGLVIAYLVFAAALIFIGAFCVALFQKIFK